MKWDGFRAFAYLEAGTVRLVSMKGNVYKAFGKLCADLAGALPVSDAVLDGEIVHLGPDFRPQFYDLVKHLAPQHFIVFDLLWLDGHDLTGLPLVERKTALQALCRVDARIRFSEPFDSGIDLFRTVCAMDLEGIVAKRRNGRYTPEATSWAKIKNPAYSQAGRRHELFDRTAIGW